MRFERIEHPTTYDGLRVWQVTTGPAAHYLPYFYNPPLDPGARRLIHIESHDGEEQVWRLDVATGEAVRLTAARGADQNWAPYIRDGVRGIRPHFVAWTQPDWTRVLYWEGNELRAVHVDTLADELLHRLRDGIVPAVPHCSPQGWVAWGYQPEAAQERLRQGAGVPDLADELRSGCGFCVFDLVSGEPVLDIETPFWPNHVTASPDHRWILYCHEGAWNEQRMYLYDVARGTSAPLRVQDDGAALGHEFWISPTHVDYHGHKDGRGLVGVIDVVSGEYVERPSPPPGTDSGGDLYGHFHASPDNRFVVTDGEVTTDRISIAPLEGDELRFAPVCEHGWPRRLDQRRHPHPHWHSGGGFITFTGHPEPGGPSQVFLVEVDL
ncbi:TolB-like translocation protein [Flindersiella endophytica]